MEEYVSMKNEKVKQFFARAEGLMGRLDELGRVCRPALGSERYLTNQQLSELLHLSRRTLQDYRDGGILPFYRLEGKILYRESDIERILTENYNKPFD
ncbi:helix-turn-helix domain-containing protein [Coprobacter tertius]|uniref:Helix-turn-helix domain-containing protein n=1 Tax=Coprobacter tertius TaxID=2944915 RepID=A0ABT1MKH3_9BACT|nr:helix-turn-helix domain-containing protein [Coprobacter tertius]MCP9613125.1 helix-turn-helix domain-containing protein [Coprobacter tertius]